MKLDRCLVGVVLAFLTHAAFAQDSSHTDSRPIQTFYLHNTTQPNDANEILTGLRIMVDPSVRMYLENTQSAITARGTAEQLEEIRKLILTYDQPRKLYRLTYTLTDLDAGKRIGVQHWSEVVMAGQHASLMQGSKIPILTEAPDEGKNGSQTKMTYLDIGLNFDATVIAAGDSVLLKSRVERSNVADERSVIAGSDPIVRQTVLESSSTVAIGKPALLGSLDLSGTTRHLDIEVLVEAIK